MMTNDNMSIENKTNDDMSSHTTTNTPHEENDNKQSNRPSDGKPSVSIKTTTQEDVNDANKEDEDVPTPKGIMTYADIQNLAYRALQKKCKSVGLSAAGSTVVLRGRLCEHFGLSEVSVEYVDCCSFGKIILSCKHI